MLPVVALVGRPNVGKSTLFNRLTRTRDALVADFPGLTRDRKYGQASYEGGEFIVIDTGGMEGLHQGVELGMAEQSLVAIQEADVVMFMVDVREGLTVADQSIADHLRRENKQVFLVGNKIDGLDAEVAIAEFHQLALGDIHPIAAAHGRGVSMLLENTLGQLVDSVTTDMEPDYNEPRSSTLDEDFDVHKDTEELQQRPIKLAIIGRPNVGKSTLTNRILGEERVVVYDMPGTTRDSIYIPMTRGGREYVLIDTAGIRRRKRVANMVEKFSIIKTLQAIEDSNVVLLVIDAREGISDQDLSLLGFTLNAGRSLVIAVNKWDGLDSRIKEDIKSELDRRLEFIDFARIQFISALHGTGVGHLFTPIDEAYLSATKRVGTATLTRIMDMAQKDHQPPLVHGRRVKLKYAHAGGYNPPLVVIHGNQVSKLPQSYKKYLVNYYRKSLKIMGTPIKIEFREGDNPFAKRGKSQSTALMRKRKRMAQFHKTK